MLLTVTQMIWPESLCRELAEKRCIIHVGSGLSCQCVNATGGRPPGWKKLLQDLSNRLSNGDKKDLANFLIEKEKYLDAAEVIRTNISSGEYASELKASFVTASYKPSASHEYIVMTSPKIFATTNFDTLMETALVDFSGLDSFTQFEHSTSGLNDAIRSPDTILLKMHGCAKRPADTILGRSDYFRLRQQHSAFFDMIASIYKVNTVLFVGCGFEDPDINLVLENIKISQPSVTHPNYALLGSLSYGARMAPLLKSQYNIEVVIYDQSDEYDHAKFPEAIQELFEEVSATRAKHGVP